jgi:protocatechuate 3,4-dioxygenase beta subunit
VNQLFKQGFLDWSKVNRRHFLCGLAALSSPSLRAEDSTPACVLASEQEEGPYYIDGALLRPDITDGKSGVPLTLQVVLMDAARCSPLSNAAVDIWHCDAVGVYSGFESQSADQGRGPMRPRPPGRPGFDGAMPPPPPPQGPGGRGRPSASSARFLRGVQITNKRGVAEFRTIYPGWYAGRTIHIHLKVHLGGEEDSGAYGGGHVSHTGQLFFPEDVTESIAKLEPYAQHAGVPRTMQKQDGIFRSQHGADSILKLEKASGGSASAGFLATVVLAVDPESTPRPVGGGGRGPGRGMPPPRDSVFF